jgi:hypothetical protein
MGILFRFLLLAAAFPIVPVLFAQSPHKAANAPFSISITLEQSGVKAGSQVWLDVVLTSTSDQNVVVAGCVDENYEVYDIEVYDSEGKRLPQRNECLPSENPNQITVCVTASTPVIRTCVPQNQVLKPNGEMKEKILVNELYDLSRPDKYSVQVVLVNNPRTFIEVPRKFQYGFHDLELDDKVNDASRATVKSNTVTLTIEPAP